MHLTIFANKSAAWGSWGKCARKRQKGKMMILLVTTSSRAKDYAAALQRGTGHKAQVASSVPQATAKLQAAEYSVMATDQSILESDLGAMDNLLNHCGAAMPIQVNLAVHSPDRIVREVQVALRRSESERVVAERLAGRVLRHELRNELTGILLNSELALRGAAVPQDVSEKIRSVRELAEKMRARLELA
jgi:signal transduction histidine kinase